MVISTVNRLEYRDLLEWTQCPINFFQSDAYCEYLEKLQIPYSIFIGQERNEVLYACIVSFRPAMKWLTYAYSPREWVALRQPEDLHHEGLLQEWICGLQKALRQKGAIAWILESGVELQQRDAHGQILSSGFHHDAYRSFLAQNGLRPSVLWTGYSNTQQTRFASAIDLVDHVPTGLPIVPDASMSVLTLNEILARMPGAQRRRMTLHSYILVDTPNLEEGLPDLEAMTQKAAMLHGFAPICTKKLRAFVEAFDERAMLIRVRLDVRKVRKEKIEVLQEAMQAIQELEAALADNPRLKKKKVQLQDWKDRQNQAVKVLDSIESLCQPVVTLACGLFLFTPFEAYYLSGGSDRTLSGFNGAYLMQRRALEECFSRKILRYNLWGISGYFEPGQPGYGVFHFKEGLGAVPLEYCGAFSCPLRFPGSFFLRSLMRKGQLPVREDSARFRALS